MKFAKIQSEQPLFFRAIWRIPPRRREIFEQINRLNLRPEILINNAGFGLLGRFWELDEMEQVRMVQVNVAALTHLTRLFLPGFIERRRGRILNVASTAAFQPGPLMSVYYATKAYVVSFSEAIHNEARDYGVDVTCLCPGPPGPNSNSAQARARRSYSTAGARWTRRKLPRSGSQL